MHSYRAEMTVRRPELQHTGGLLEYLWYHIIKSKVND